MFGLADKLAKYKHLSLEMKKKMLRDINFRWNKGVLWMQPLQALNRTKNSTKLVLGLLQKTLQIWKVKKILEKLGHSLFFLF